MARSGTLLVSGSFDKTVRLWDSQTNVAAGVLTGHDASVQAVAISGTGKLVASGGDDRSIRLWNVETKSLLKAVPGHSRTIEIILGG